MTMPRRLTLLRHGHAQVSAAGGDVDRALDETGRAEVAATASAFAEFERPSKLLVSSARRTRETAEIVIHTLGLEHVQTEYLPELYLASAATLRRTLDLQPDDHTRILLIGHNPGLSDFVFEMLAADPQRDTYRGLQTAGWASCECVATSWRAFSPNPTCTITLG